ncbi:hypothetical protein AALO_G00086330 [Alosa alosa]|uniref:Uncharacterized protein n=1 Tax=Alosa alosa TaxID=278164 RepID=A0AAV6GZ97_9TELE|nr:hypothetical protein AALO_G00086330 [Alosa alosa]
MPLNASLPQSHIWEGAVSVTHSDRVKPPGGPCDLSVAPPTIAHLSSVTSCQASLSAAEWPVTSEQSGARRVYVHVFVHLPRPRRGVGFGGGGGGGGGSSRLDFGMSGNGNPCPPGVPPPLGAFSVPHYSYFFPHMLGGLSPPALPGLSVSGYSTPSPASEYPLSFSFPFHSSQNWN